MTNARFKALVERHRKQMLIENERADYRAGVIAASVLNTIPRTKNNRNAFVHPQDIFPEYDWKPKAEMMSIDQMIIMNAAAGGTLVELN